MRSQQAAYRRRRPEWGEPPCGGAATPTSEALGGAPGPAFERHGIEGIDHDRPPRTPEEALQALLDGNRRYLSGAIRSADYSRLGDRIAETQAPFAAIVTCADSRLSAPVIFDLGLSSSL